MSKPSVKKFSIRARLVATFSSLTLFGALAITSPVSAADAVVYALPGAPTNVVASSAPGGVYVTWNAPANTGNSPIASYTITGGAGTCAITVPGTATSAFVPATVNQPANIFSVTATNALGNSADGQAAGITAAGKAYGARVFTKAGKVSLIGEGADVDSAASAVAVAASTRDGRGFWTADSKGNITASGSAAAISASLAGTVAIIPALDDKGFTLVSSSGKVASFGSAKVSGSVSGGKVVGAVGTADGKGVWAVLSNGTIKSVGTAGKAAKLRGSIVAVTGNTARTGGWAVRNTGQVVPFGKAGKLSGDRATKPVSAWHTTGNGVWVLNADGSISSFGDAAPVYTTYKGAVAITGAAPDMVPVSVTFNYLSDFHGQIEANAGVGGAAALKAYFDRDRALGQTLVISSGDNIGAAPPISSQFDELPTILAMNKMGVDFSTFGNHEHDRPLASLNKSIEASTFQWVVSNYSSLASLPKVKEYAMVEKNGLKVAFVGANTTETPSVVFPGNMGDIKIGDPIEGVNKAIAAARKAGADIVVANIHEGFAEFQGAKAVGPLVSISEKIVGADLISGGHSHNKWSGRVNGTLVQQVVNAGASYTRTQVCMDKATKSLIGVGNQFITPTVAGVTPDAETAALVKSYADQLAVKYDTKIGTVNGVFPFGGTPAIQRQGEAAIGDYFADILKTKYKTDLVIINGGGIRANLPALTYKTTNTTLVRPTSASSTGTFDLLLGDVYTVLPFGNQVATTSLTGTQLWAALENGVSQVETNAGRFPQIAGFKFTFDPSKPAGSRVTAVTKTDGTAIAKNDTSYTVTTLDFMIYGGDGYTMFNPTKAQIRDLYAQVIVDAILAKPAVTIPALDGRITRVG